MTSEELMLRLQAFHKRYSDASWMRLMEDPKPFFGLKREGFIRLEINMIPGKDTVYVQLTDKGKKWKMGE
jgi:hypothetical protein